METILVLIGLILFWIVGLAVAYSLCYSAGNADERMDNEIMGGESEGEEFGRILKESEDDIVIRYRR